MIFLVLFQVHFHSEHLSSTIIEFCIILLGDLQPGITIPNSLSILRQITGFSALTNSLLKYVSCSCCHCLFLLSDPNCPTTCPNNDIHYPNMCGNNLFKVIANHRRPIKEFTYQPLPASIKRLFLRPGFEAKIEEWVDVIHRQFNPHEFYILSTDIRNAGSITGSKLLPPDAYSRNCGSKTFMPERLYNFLLNFYRDVYGDHLVHYTNAGEGRRFVGNRYCKMRTITLMDQNYHSVEAR